MKKDIHPKYYPKTKAKCSCGAVFELGSTKEEIETKFGNKLSWERLDDKRASRIAYRFEGIGGLKDNDKWDEIRTKLVDAMIRLEEVFRDYIKRLE